MPIGFSAPNGFPVHYGHSNSKKVLTKNDIMDEQNKMITFKIRLGSEHVINLALDVAERE